MTTSLLIDGYATYQKRHEQMEIWKDIVGFEGYQVSNMGRVRTYGKTTHTDYHGTRYWKDRILKPKVSKRDKRVRVCLWKDGKEYTLTVHRLEAIAFLGEPADKSMTVNHKDGNPTNNNLENLEWLTLGDNIRYGFENGQFSSQIPISINNGEESLCFRSFAECDRYLGRREGYTSGTKNKGRKVVRSKGGEVYAFSF